MAAGDAKGLHPLGDTGQVKAAEREAARQRERELAELAVRAQRRGNRILVAATAGGLAGFTAAVTLTRVLVQHQRFSWLLPGEAAGSYLAVTALIWGGYFAWERWRRA
jgi:hypothetical protein